VTNSWKKGCKTIFKVGGDGTTFYLVTDSGVKLMRRAQTTSNQQTQEDQKEEKSQRQRRKKFKSKLSHAEWIRFARKKKRAMTKIFRKKPAARTSEDGGASGGPQLEEEYSTESVLDRRWRGNRWEYRVKWKGYKKHTWEPIENLTSDGVHNKDLLHFLKVTGGTLNDVPRSKDLKQK